MTTRLIIARHGNTFEPDEMPTRVGKTDLPLVASGRAQGRALGRYLHEHKLQPVQAYTSTLKRTIGMVEEINHVTGWNVAHTPLHCFDEIDYGEDENQPEANVVQRLGQKAINLWDTQAIVPEGWRVDVEAIKASWQEIARKSQTAYQGQTILIVTSNGIARFAPYILPDPDSFYSVNGMKMKTGAMSLFVYENAQWRCAFWNKRP